MSRLRLLPTMLLATCLAATGARAQSWIGTGTPVVTAPGEQVAVRACSDGADGVYVTWADFRGADADIYLQHLDANGAVVAGWPSSGLAVCAAIRQQLGPVLIADGAGGVYVAWTDYRTNSADVFLTRIQADGTRAAGWSADGDAVSSQVAIRTNPQLALAPGGGVYVAFERATSSLDVFLTRLDGSAVRASGWPVAGLALTTSAADEDSPVIATDATGACVAVWVNEDVNGGDLRGARVWPNGVLASGWTAADGRELLPTAGLQSDARLVTRADGGLLVYFLDHSQPGNTQVRATGVDSAGTALAGWNDPAGAAILVLASRDAVDFSVCGDGADGAVAVAREYDPAQDHATLHAIRHDASHTLAWPDTVQLTLPGVTSPAALVRDSQGGFLVAYADTFASSAGQDVRMIRLAAADGAIAGGWSAGTGNAVCIEPGEQFAPVIVASGSGSGIAAWIDGRGADLDVYAARVGADGAVPALASLVSASVRDGCVELLWYSGAAGATAATVERRSPDGAWAVLASVIRDGDGRYAFTDHDVRAGARYGYRLRSGAAAGPAVWVDLPADAPLGLALVRSGAGATEFAVTLGSAAPAMFQWYDISGRLRHEVPLAGAGTHAVRVPGSAPGIYLARVSQAGTSATLKCRLLR
jgi:hypothetical protein